MKWTVAILTFACCTALAIGKPGAVTRNPNERGFTLIGPAPDYDCPANGAFPHEINCELYYDCYNDFANLMGCTENTLFELEYTSCADAATVDCGNRVRPNGTTGPPPTRTTTSRPPQTGTPPVGGPECTPDNHGAFYPDTIYCERYYECDNYDTILHYCEDDLLFDLTFYGCNFPDKVDCGDRVRPNGTTGSPPTRTTTSRPPQTGTPPVGGPECTPEHHGAFYPDTTYCERYYECDNYDAILHYCEDDLLFDLTFYGCNFPDKVDCGDRIRPGYTGTGTYVPPTRPTEAPPEYDCPNDGAFPHEIYCEKYWDCYNDVATLMNCPNDWLFGIVWSGCEPPSEVECGDRIRPNGTTTTTVRPPITTTTLDPPPTTTTGAPPPTTTTPPPEFRCPEADGNFPDPSDCGAFFQCSNGVAHRVKCDVILRYSIPLEVCDFPENVDCGERPVPPI